MPCGHPDVSDAEVCAHTRIHVYGCRVGLACLIFLCGYMKRPNSSQDSAREGGSVSIVLYLYLLLLPEVSSTIENFRISQLYNFLRCREFYIYFNAAMRVYGHLTLDTCHHLEESQI